MVNIIPFEIFVFIEGNLFLAKYVTKDGGQSFFKTHIWAYVCLAWFLMFWVFLPPLSLMFLCIYPKITETKVLKGIMIGIGIIMMLTTIILTRMTVLYEDPYNPNNILYLLYVSCWIYIILLIAFRKYIKYLNYLQLSTVFIVIGYLSKFSCFKRLKFFQISNNQNY